jgi:hypothetical protein
LSDIADFGLTVREALRYPALGEAWVVAGAAGLDRTMRWVQSSITATSRIRWPATSSC